MTTAGEAIPPGSSLAEALARRGELRNRLDSLRGRITANARHQEGDEPSEDAAALLEQAGVTLTELEDLIRRINRTNSATDLGADGTMTDALARRDVLRMRHSLLVAAADAASGQDDRVRFGGRQLHSELRQVSALPVPRLREEADGVARRLRELDARIQRVNWTTAVLE
ncbi:DIP1984 family protein [Pseudonocardia nantongensis]|uniref:DIP1984 family protein n=1 Tax=Pseudonocardia nantongensis TaxID=1181885 RepID=UPI00397D9709